MKFLVLIYGIILLPLLNYAQTNKPDTLQLDIKTGQKIILIGDDLNSFRTIKTDSIIQKALLSVKDSLGNNRTMDSEKIPKHVFRIWTSIGAGLVTDRISPFWGLQMDFQRNRTLTVQGKQVLVGQFSNVALNIFYSFERENTGNYDIRTNIFIEGTFGNRYMPNDHLSQYEFSGGFGYLIKKEGGYFQKNTFKVFLSIIPDNSSISLKPEIYITNNFRKVFPGITLTMGLLALH